MSFRVGRRIREGLVRINLLQSIAALTPARAFLLAFGVGIALAIASAIVDVHFFSVEIQIHHTGGVAGRGLKLGYLEQTNYGIWYVVPFFCPFLFLFISLAYQATSHVTVKTSRFIVPFNELGKSWRMGLIGLLLLVGFVGKNILVEVEDYKSLSLGWVQAETLEQYRAQIELTGPVDLTAAGKRFNAVLLPREHKIVSKSDIQKVSLTKVDPHLRVKNHWTMLAFIAIAKAWVGLWEALVIYVAFLSLLWASYAYARLRREDIYSQDKKKYELSWFLRPALYLILVSVWVNLFCIFRFCGNAIKGSYGNWDQYWSFLTLTPAVVVLILGSLILSKVYGMPSLEGQTYVSKEFLVAGAVWLGSFTYLIYLFLGFLHPEHLEVMVICFKPFAELLKAVFG